MGFLDMFDNPDIMSSLLGINTAVGSPGAMPQAPAPRGEPYMSGGMMGEVLDQAPPQYQDVGLMKRDQLPPGQPAGPTMAGVGFPPPPSGSAMAAPANPTPLPSPSVPNFGRAGYGGGSPDQIATGVGPTPAPTPISTGPLNSVPAPPPPQGVAGPPISTYGSLGAALGLNNPRVGNAITAGLAGLGRGLTAVGQMHPGASGAQAFAAGAGGGLEGGIHQLDVQQAQARQAKMDNFLMTSNAFKDWIAARHADNEEDMTRFKGDYFRARAQAAMTGGGGARGMQTPEQQAAFVEGASLRYRDQLRKGNEARIKNPELGKPYSDEDLDARVENYRKGLYKHFNMNPKEGARLAEAGIDEKNPISLKGITTREEFDRQVPENAFYDTGKKFDDKGEYKYTRADGTQDVHHGPPGSAVILQRMPSPQATAAPQQQSSSMDDYLASQGLEAA